MKDLRILIAITKELKNKAIRKAKNLGLSVSSYICQLIAKDK